MLQRNFFMHALLGSLLFLMVAHGEAKALDQDVRPDGTSTEAFTSCTSANAHTTLDDDVDGAGADWCTADTCSGGSASNPSIRLTMPTPPEPPSTAANAQIFAAKVRKCSAGAENPTCRLSLYCNFGLTFIVGNNQSVTNTTSEIITEDFTYPAACADDGSDLEIVVACTKSSAGAGALTGDIESVEWRFTSATGHTIIIVGEPKRSLLCEG